MASTPTVAFKPQISSPERPERKIKKALRIHRHHACRSLRVGYVRLHLETSFVEASKREQRLVWHIFDRETLCLS
jgi:hypothetical protein